MKYTVEAVLFLMLGLFQASPALARSDDLIQREIEAQIADSTELRGTRIEVQVEQRLVVLTGQVRLYEQKLVSDRIAWTTLGVFEVDNEIRVVPKLPLANAAIEQKVREIIKTHQRFHGAGVVVAVDNGVVFIQGSFSGIGDPAFLKHQVAAIEGVVDINIHATFLARLQGTG
ncbi:MAG: BON domain-containing protein [Pseudomonadota bacterium]|nr:BON domain-containing protein [Pseudomonadota bacterium]